MVCYAPGSEQVILPDGSIRTFAPAHVLSVGNTGIGLGTASNPVPLVRPNEVVSTFTNGNQNTVTFSTDRYGAATVTTNPLNHQTTTVRNIHSKPLTITTPNGAVTRRSYDDQGNVLTLIEAENATEERTSTFEYHPVFNLVTKITDPAQKVTTIIRDANGNPERVINPLLDERVRTFDSRGLVLTDTDENQQTMTFTYDANGNVDTITDPEGHITRFVRDLAGNITTLIKGEGTIEQRTRIMTYDDLNRLTSATDGTVNPPMLFRYDDQGNLEETELPTGEIEFRTYEEQNRVVSIDNPRRGLTTFEYDPDGNLLETRNALNDPTTFEYDDANHLTKIIDANGGEQVFTYNEEGNIETFMDARQNVTQQQVTMFDYNLLNQLTKRTNPLQQITMLTYDERGDRKSVV